MNSTPSVKENVLYTYKDMLHRKEVAWNMKMFEDPLEPIYTF